VGELLELVDLAAAADRKVGGFSLGMKQRLGLAGALIGNPALLVLDEPANGLDPEGMRWLRDFLRSLAGEGHTVLLSSHVLAEVAQTADDVVVIAAGRLVTHAPLEQLTATHENRRVRVRSSDPSQLAAALRSRGLVTEEQAAGALLVAGATAALVGETAFDAQLVLHELTEDASSLEDIFLNITNPAEEALR
jgi:ABC-2 type transport system ATP-binding protein